MVKRIPNSLIFQFFYCTYHIAPYFKSKGGITLERPKKPWVSPTCQFHPADSAEYNRLIALIEAEAALDAKNNISNPETKYESAIQ